MWTKLGSNPGQSFLVMMEILSYEHARSNALIIEFGRKLAEQPSSVLFLYEYCTGKRSRYAELLHSSVQVAIRALREVLKSVRDMVPSN